MLGGEKMPCVGLGFGDVVVMDLLGDVGKSPTTTRSVEYAVGFMDDACRSLALDVAARLRDKGESCDLALTSEKPRRFFGRADKCGARYAIYIGPEEAASGEFSIKPLRGGEARKVALAGL